MPVKRESGGVFSFLLSLKVLVFVIAFVLAHIRFLQVDFILVLMLHCVYCAAKIEKNKESIQRALSVYEWLSEEWELEHDAVLCSYHSKITKADDGGNILIFLENDSVYQLIEDCMEFATALQKLKNRKYVK